MKTLTTSTVTCDECGGEWFEEVVTFRPMPNMRVTENAEWPQAETRRRVYCVECGVEKLATRNPNGYSFTSIDLVDEDDLGEDV